MQGVAFVGEVLLIENLWHLVDKAIQPLVFGPWIQFREWQVHVGWEA